MFKEKEAIVTKYFESNNGIMDNDNKKTFTGQRGLNDDFKEEIFPHDLIPKRKNIESGMDTCMKIKGNLDHYKFMNVLVDKIKKELYEDLDTSKAKEKYEFKIVFENDDDAGEEKNDKNKEPKMELNFNNFIGKKKDWIIKVNLFDCGNEEYALRFLREKGDLAEYYSKVMKIVDLAKKLI